MSVSFPSIFPHPTISNYGVRPQTTTIRTEMENGTARQRRRFTSAPTIISVRWIMQDSTYGFFEAWYLNRIDDGAAWFNITLKTGTGNNVNSARFTEKYRASLISYNFYEVTATLEVRDIQMISNDLLTVAIDLDLSSDVATELDELLQNYIHDMLSNDLEF